MAKVVAVYALRHPATNEVRYIGITSMSLAKRLALHMSAGRRNVHSMVSRWVRGLIQHGMQPLIESVEENSSPEREEFWIQHYRDSGRRLLNMIPGGGVGPNGHKRSEETRRRMSEAQKGNKHRLGQKNTPEHRRKISESMLGNRNSAGVSPTQETRDRIRSTLTGHEVTQETRDKIANALRGRLRGGRPQEIVDKIAASKRGTTHSEESRRKMSESAKRRWAKVKNENISA